MDKEDKKALFMVDVITMIIVIPAGVIAIFVVGYSDPSYITIIPIMLIIFFAIVGCVELILIITFYSSLKAIDKEQDKSKKEVDEFFEEIEH